MSSPAPSIAQRRLQSAYTAASGTLMVIGLIAALLLFALRPETGLSGGQAVVFSVALGAFFVFGTVLVCLMIRQERINSIMRSQLALWEYNSRYLYRYRRQEAARKKPIVSLVFLLPALVLAGIGISYSALPEGGTLYYVIAAVLFALAVLCFPPVICRLRYLLMHLFGHEKHIVLARRGIFAVNRLLYFGFNSTTFFKAEQCKVGSFYCLAFYYHRHMGFSVVTQVYYVPVPPDVTPAELDALLAVYNSAELFYASDNTAAKG